MKVSFAKVIAEIGVNHNGSFKRAVKLIKAAKFAGAHFVKFQIFKTENLVLKNTRKANYQTKNDKSANQYQMLKKFELTNKDFKRIINFCKKIKIKFLATPFDLESVDFLKRNKLEYIKISSADINNYPLLKKIGSNRKKVLLSTGMATIKEINYAIKTLVDGGTKRKNITIFHCTSSYPTPLEDVNLNVLKTFKKKFGMNIGYSDHTNSIIIPSFALMLGAKFIEKHITLNNNDVGPDHKASLNYKNFKLMIKIIKDLEISLGSGLKKITKSEKINLKYIRRSIYAKKNIKKGDIFSSSNIITKRPSTGLSPVKWNKLIGKVSKRNFLKDEKIKI